MGKSDNGKETMSSLVGHFWQRLWDSVDPNSKSKDYNITERKYDSVDIGSMSI